jgi:hypothetical protein
MSQFGNSFGCGYRSGRRPGLKLAAWFGLHVIFPSANTVDRFAIVVGMAAFIGMTRWKWDIIPIVLGAGLVGLLFKC